MTKKIMTKNLVLINILAIINVLILFFSENLTATFGIPQYTNIINIVGFLFLIIIFIVYYWILKTNVVKDNEIKEKYSKPEQPWGKH